AARLGLAVPAVARASAMHPPFAADVCRTILIDAPCSGLGTVSRRPDIKLRRAPADLGALAALQARILDAAAGALPSGGRIAYITCTLNPQENEAQVERLLAARGATGGPLFTVEAHHVTPVESPAREFFFGVLLRKA
ncbi:sun protein, partial [Desulfovibrio sp. A2]